MIYKKLDNTRISSCDKMMASVILDMPKDYKIWKAEKLGDSSIHLELEYKNSPVWGVNYPHLKVGACNYQKSLQVLY